MTPRLRPGRRLSLRALAALLLAACLSACGQTGYIQRNDGVYYASYPGTSANPSLKRVERRIDADPASFRVDFPGVWASDKDQAFYRGKPVGAVDQPSFQALDAQTAHDARTVWQQGKVIEGADGSSFRKISGLYAIDASAVWYGSTRLDACDPASFALIEGEDDFAVDDLCAYAGSFRLPVTDRASFGYLGAGYWRDASGVNWRRYSLEGADPDTFHVPRGMMYGKDKNGCWSGDRAIPCLKD